MKKDRPSKSSSRLQTGANSGNLRKRPDTRNNRIRTPSAGPPGLRRKIGCWRTTCLTSSSWSCPLKISRPSFVRRTWRRPPCSRRRGRQASWSVCLGACVLMQHHLTRMSTTRWFYSLPLRLPAAGGLLRAGRDQRRDDNNNGDDEDDQHIVSHDSLVWSADAKGDQRGFCEDIGHVQHQEVTAHNSR